MSEGLTSNTTTDEHPKPIEFLGDVTLQLTLELGRVDISIRRLLSLKPGSVLELDTAPGQALALRANGNIIARGEPICVNSKMGLRVTETVDKER